MTAEEILHPRVEKVAQENLSRVREYGHERHQRPPCPANRYVSKVTPVDLCFLARQAAQSQIGLGFTARSMPRDQVAEVIRAAGVAAFTHHRINACRRQRWKALQCLLDERQIGVDLGTPRRSVGARQTGLRQHAAHHVVMDVQLSGDCAHTPFLRVVVT